MFNGHTMSLVTDLRMVLNQLTIPNFLTVAAITTSDYPNYEGIYNASILVPPTELLLQWAELSDDPANGANASNILMQNEYPRYLMSKDPDDMIVALIAAMTAHNIVLYIPQDEFNIFGMLLLNHLYYTYGITCNFMGTSFSVDPNKLPFIMAKFYMIDVMSYDDFMAAYPGNWELPAFVIQKMASEVPSLGGPADYQQYADYFNQINASKLNNQPKQMVTLVGDQK